MGSIARFKPKQQYSEAQQLIFELRKYCNSLVYLAEVLNLKVEVLNKIITGDHEPVWSEIEVMRSLVRKFSPLNDEERFTYIVQKIFGNKGFIIGAGNHAG